MSKELPYFRFNPAEWQNGDISLESVSIKGLFIDICAYYWLKDCSVTLSLLIKKFNDENGVNQLIKSGVIKHNPCDDFCEIHFLNEQFDVLSNLRKSRQEAGSKGGKQKSSKAKAKLKQSCSKSVAINNDKDKDKYNIDFEVFWNLYPKERHTKKEYCLQYWNKELMPNERKIIIDTLPSYIKSVSELKYLKQSEFFFKNKKYLDESFLCLIKVNKEERKAKHPEWQDAGRFQASAQGIPYNPRNYFIPPTVTEEELSGY